MVTVTASVLDTYPDKTEVVTLSQCETQPHRVHFRLMQCRTREASTSGKQDKSILTHHAKEIIYRNNRKCCITTPTTALQQFANAGRKYK